MMSHPQTIQIFPPTGDPQGIRVAEITTRIVRVIEVARSLIGEFLQMTEAEQVGVYLLFYAGFGKMGTQLNLYTDTIGSIRIALPQEAEIEQILVAA